VEVVQVKTIPAEAVLLALQYHGRDHLLWIRVMHWFRDVEDVELARPVLSLVLLIKEREEVPVTFI
jgi:hypothetical protein